MTSDSFSTVPPIVNFTTLQNSTTNPAGHNPKSMSQEAVYHGILARTSLRYQVIEKLLWKQSEDASQK